MVPIFTHRGRTSKFKKVDDLLDEMDDDRIINSLELEYKIIANNQFFNPNFHYLNDIGQGQPSSIAHSFFLEDITSSEH
jgi:hypothetical protein